jgi:O-antigen/teichoic acid export membrane protein
MSRTDKSIKNILFAITMQGITILSAFIIRTVITKELGLQIVSINGLFTEVISALSLTELGVGSAIVFNMYKPLADGDTHKVCQLMKLFQKAYYAIAGITLGIGLLICPFIHLIIKSVDYSIGYIQLIYILFVIQLSVSYLFSYKASLLNADQNNHIYSKIIMLFKVIVSVVQIVLLYSLHNYVVFLLVSIIFSLLQNIIMSIIVSRLYPYLQQKVEKLTHDETKFIFANIKNLFVKTLSGKITNSTDNILISILVNTLQVGIYTQYTLILGVFRSLSDQIVYNGLKASIGNLLVTEENEKCSVVLKRMTYFFYLFASFSCVGIFVSVTPFIKAWLSDQYLLSTSIIFICCVNLFVEITFKPLWAMLEVSGLFREDKYISIIGSLINLILSIILGLRIGMLGIFIGTLSTYLIQMILKVRLFYYKRLELSPARYYLYLISMMVGLLLQIGISYYLCSFITLDKPLLQFLLNSLISVVVVTIFNFLLTRKTKEYSYLVNLLKRYIFKA